MRSYCLLFSLVVVASGCTTSWKARPATPQEVLQSTGETEVQVILITGARVVLRDPGVEGDSLVGWSKPGGTALPERQVFALTDVHALATRKNVLALNLSLGMLTRTAIALSAAGGVAVSPAALATEPKEVRVTRPDGTRFILYDPRMTPDSIAGVSEGDHLALPLSEVSRLAVPSASKSQLEAGTTFVGAAFAAIGIWILIAVLSN